MPDLYIDESHFHRDLDLGYTWVTLGLHLGDRGQARLAFE